MDPEHCGSPNCLCSASCGCTPGNYVGPRSPASCNIQRCESPASWEHPEIYCISYSHLQKVSKFCLLLCLLKWILNFVGHCFLAVDSLVFVEGFVD
ncbi:hypothetical protein BDL97_04G028300 [Sphagnum fallax]|nr:hypothetical protein BDL97_04G028300 [Sphagnum fallax]